MNDYQKNCLSLSRRSNMRQI